MFIRQYYKLIITLTVIFVAVILLLPSVVVNEAHAGFQLGNSVQAAATDSGPGQMAENSNGNNVLANVKDQERFRLIIPKAGVDHTVIANVDPGNKNIYGPVIENYVAHGKYTRLPDEATQKGNVYLFAHREGYANGRNIGFFKHLDKLADGDMAYIKYAGKTYVYQYRDEFIVTPEDTWVYTAHSDFPALTLQTCENGVKQRLMVKFKLVRVLEN